MALKKHKHYSLQIAISSLFITIIVILGLILSWQSYSKTSDVMLRNAEDIYTRITNELVNDFRANYGSIAGTLRQFRLSPVSKAQTFKNRFKFIPDFLAIIDSNPSVFIAGIAYENGDYFGVTHVTNDYVKKNHVIPDNAVFMVLYFTKSSVDPNFIPGKLYSIIYDKKFNELSRNEGKKTQFDLRTRDWYKNATIEPRATKPYVFYDTDIVGLTATSKTAEPGVVVALDVTLENLSEMISKYDITPDSEVVLINAKGQTFAYKDPSKVVIKTNEVLNNDTLQLANLKQLGSGVLKYLSNYIEAKNQDLKFTYDGRQWIGSARVIAKPGGVDLYALILSPVDELLADAVKIRWQLLSTTFIILLLFIPLIWFTSRKISTPMNSLAKEADAISHFDFSHSTLQTSFIKEVSNLNSAIEMMKTTINKFISLINSLAGEPDLDILLTTIATETMLISHSDGVLIYLLDEKDDLLKADFLSHKLDGEHTETIAVNILPKLTLDDASRLLLEDDVIKSRIIEITRGSTNQLSPLLELLSLDEISCLILPLQNRNNDIIGLLTLIYYDGDTVNEVSNIEFVEALSGFAAVTLESRQLFNMQEALLHSFIKLIAGAIDAKSPYTGGHCQRVPEITMMLAKSACESTNDLYKNFNLSDKQWQELNIACWLHDCGKVTTPEYVVDKATKLETIYDRIHEVRMRFEVLKRDCEIDCWQKIADGGNKENLLSELEQRLKHIDDDYVFVADCNIGGEFMDEEKITRLHTIAEKTWLRTLDDSVGISWEELNRKTQNNIELPVKEKILDNKVEHIIKRDKSDRIADDNPYDFNIDTPEYKYNRGELYNLSVKRGTLNDEERYMINSHMIQTIIMLNNLPYPKHLRNVPLIAGSHHETMDGKGYPKKLKMSEQPLTSRMMVIADIFEALTASDRPYKKAKTLNESIRILSFMRNDKHIDADLFDLFLTSGVYREYASQYLKPEQIDEVDIGSYLFSAKKNRLNE
ncbi:MAG: HD domain-containing phosphohydrolase [Gammaproteobacteria bacterium]